MKIKTNHFTLLLVSAFSLGFFELMNAHQEKHNFSNFDYTAPFITVIPDNRTVNDPKNAENDCLKKLISITDSTFNVPDNQDDIIFNSKYMIKIVL